MTRWLLLGVENGNGILVGTQGTALQDEIVVGSYAMIEILFRQGVKHLLLLDTILGVVVYADKEMFEQILSHQDWDINKVVGFSNALSKLKIQPLFNTMESGKELFIGFDRGYFCESNCLGVVMHLIGIGLREQMPYSEQLCFNYESVENYKHIIKEIECMAYRIDRIHNLFEWDRISGGKHIIYNIKSMKMESIEKGVTNIIIEVVSENIERKSGGTQENLIEGIESKLRGLGIDGYVTTEIVRYGSLMEVIEVRIRIKDCYARQFLGRTTMYNGVKIYMEYCQKTRKDMSRFL